VRESQADGRECIAEVDRGGAARITGRFVSGDLERHSMGPLSAYILEFLRWSGWHESHCFLCVVRFWVCAGI